MDGPSILRGATDFAKLQYLKKKGFKDLPDYSKWQKVADAVIEARKLPS
jgi:hypothetical protein